MGDRYEIISNRGAAYFITIAVVYWMDVFTQKTYRDIVLDSLRYCQQEKGLVVHSWCIMSNHLHMVVSVSDNKLGDILRTFKKFTSRELLKSIAENSADNRREWLLEWFSKAGRANRRNRAMQFWQQQHQLVALHNTAFVSQRINDTHQPPVEAGIVARPEDYVYSSARDYTTQKNCGLLNIVFLYRLP